MSVRVIQTRWVCPPELLTSSLGRRECGDGPLRDSTGFLLGYGSHNVKHEAVCLREIYGSNFYPRFHKVSDEGYVASEAIKLGNEKRGSRCSSVR